MSPDSPPTPTRRRVLRGGALLGVGGLAGCTAASDASSETDDVSVDIDGAHFLEVRTPAGDVSLVRGSGTAVTGTATKWSRSGDAALGSISVEPTAGDQAVVVEPDRSDGGDVGVDLALAVPDELLVDVVETEAGDVDASGVRGGNYRTARGDVDLRNVRGYVTVESTRGDVTVRDVDEFGALRTFDGDVDVHVRDVGPRTAVQTSRGDVTAAVPDDLDCAVSLHATRGDVRTDGVSLADREGHALAVRGRLQPAGSDESASEFDIPVGTTEPTLSLRSENGDVTLTDL